MKSLISIHPAIANPDPGIPSELKQFKGLAAKLSSSAWRGLLSIAAIAAALNVAPSAKAQYYYSRPETTPVVVQPTNSATTQPGFVYVLPQSQVVSTNNFLFAQTEPLRLGSRGAGVSALQQQLNNEGFRIQVDGVYGLETQTAILNFQQRCGLQVDGVAGPETTSSLASGTCGGQAVRPDQPGTVVPAGPYVVAVPGNDPVQLNIARTLVANAFVDESGRGSFINLGGYQSRSSANELSSRARNVGLPARVEFRR